MDFEVTRAPSIRRSFLARGIATTATLACTFGLAATAQAQGPVEIVAPSTARASQDIRFAADASPATAQVTFYVDGQRRWVDSSPGWQFGRNGYLPPESLRPGRHELMVKAETRGGKVTATKRPIHVARRSAISRVPDHQQDSPAFTPASAAVPISASAPVPTPTSPPVPAPTAPAPTPAPTPTPTPQPEPEPAPTPAPEPTPTPTPAPEPAAPKALLDAGFENGLKGWNTAGVGEVMPNVVSDSARTGSDSCRMALSGSQNRSELILGGNGGGNFEPVKFTEGAEYWYGFSFDIKSMVYGHPGAHNLIMQFYTDGYGPNFGLQLWNYAGDDGKSGGKGLWSHGGAMGGDRYLSPLAEQQWHDVQIHFKASSQGAGFYQVYLDGNLVDSRQNVSMIAPGHEFGYIKDGLYRNGGTIPGSSEIRLDAAKLGTSQSSVLPG